MDSESDSIVWPDENLPTSPKPSGSTTPTAEPDGKERNISFSIKIPTKSFDLSKITASVTVSSSGQSSTTATSKTTPAIDWKVTPQKSEKRKLISNQLVLLLHAQKCIELNAADSTRKCALEHCATAKNILRHLEKCDKGQKCDFPHCASSRQIMLHWNSCQLLVTCPVCVPVKKRALEIGPGPSDALQLIDRETQEKLNRYLSELASAQDEWAKLNEAFVVLTEKVCKTGERQKLMKVREKELEAAMDSLLPILEQIKPDQADTMYAQFLRKVHTNITNKQSRLAASYAASEEKIERLKKRIQENALATRAVEERGNLACANAEQLHKQATQSKKPQPKPLEESLSVNERKQLLTMMKKMRLNKKSN